MTVARPHHVGVTVNELTRAGEVWPPRASPEPGRRMAFVHDLDGNLVELLGPPE